MSQIRRYLKILSLSDLILKDMRQAGAVEDTQGYENVSTIRKAAFAQLVRDGMPADFANGFLTIEDSGKKAKIFFNDIADDYLDVRTIANLLSASAETVRERVSVSAAYPESEDTEKAENEEVPSPENTDNVDSRGLQEEDAEKARTGPVAVLEINADPHINKDAGHMDIPEDTAQIQNTETYPDPEEAGKNNNRQSRQGQRENAGKDIYGTASEGRRLSGLVQAHCMDGQGTGGSPTFNRDDMQFTEINVTVTDPDGEDADIVQLYVMPIADEDVLNLLIGTYYQDDNGEDLYNVWYGNGSIKVPFGGYSIIVKGGIDKEGHLDTSVMLSRKNAERGYSIKTEEIRHDGGTAHTHAHLSDGSGFDAHLLTFESKNNSENTANYFAVIFDGDDTVTACNIEKPYTAVPYHDTQVGLMGQWKNRELTVMIGRIS